ncbi:unnamed protein product [Lampetra fluviatilis]
MVLLHVKRGDESQFLLESAAQAPLDELTARATRIYNGRLRVERLCSVVEELASHGAALPPNMQGLTEEQLVELRLRDEWAEICVPSGGAQLSPDPCGRRGGQAPNEKMQEVLRKTIQEAKALISKNQVQANVFMTMEMVQEALDQLRGAVTIVYPMQLPPHDPVRMEIEDKAELAGMQAGLQVIDETEAQLWWAGKHLQSDKKLSDYIGKNEKTKIVIKIQKRGQGAPAREPIVSEEQQKQMMLQAYRRQEELKKLEECESDDHLSSNWADAHALKRSFQGLRDISWRPK